MVVLRRSLSRIEFMCLLLCAKKYPKVSAATATLLERMPLFIKTLEQVANEEEPLRK